MANIQTKHRIVSLQLECFSSFGEALRKSWQPVKAAEMYERSIALNPDKPAIVLFAGRQR
jgi:hypothetical protein